MVGKASRFARRAGQAILAPHSFVGSVGWTLVAIAAPTLVRLAIDGGHTGGPFVTYYPAIVLAGLFLGWRFGALAAVGCAAVARALFLPSSFRFAESPPGLGLFALFVLSCSFLIVIAEALRRVLREQQAASARELLLNEELRHRLKNLLSVVGSLSTLSQRYSDPEQAQEAFAERLAALDRATSLLGTEGNVSCNLPELPHEALAPFLAAYDIRIDGPRQAVDRDCCVPAVLALHELATNAIKYGSLSAPGGWVELGWGEPTGGTVSLRWREKGGPAVKPPERRGMGSRILSMKSDAAGFQIDFSPDGVCCDIKLKAG